jgi:uncharacterized protein YkwD
LVCLLNRERGRARLTPLEVDPRLEQSSAAHTLDMVTFGHFGHHIKGRPYLYDRIRKAGYFKGTVTALYSENLGYGPPEYASALGMHRAFMGSEGHRVNMLYGRFRSVGIGSLMIDSNPAFYPDYPAVVYTIDFGRRYASPKPRCAQPRPSASPAGASTPPHARRRSSRPRSVCRKRSR